MGEGRKTADELLRTWSDSQGVAFRILKAGNRYFIESLRDPKIGKRQVSQAFAMR